MTAALWEEHLAGTYGLGVVPITDNATCYFGAIDIDVYADIDHQKIVDAIFRLELPLVVVRSKSGGAHLYLFCREACTAELVRSRLMEWAVALGHSGVEVFPKQIRLAGLSDFGNWINMPYFNAYGFDGTNRYAIGPKGALNVIEFLDMADAFAVTQVELRAVAVKEDVSLRELWLDAPPCLQSLAKNGGIPSGMRNTGLFNVAVYLKKRYGDNFGDKLQAYNQQSMADEPLGHKEVETVIRSVNKKAYTYKCREEPIVSCCNRQICLTRKYGVGREESTDSGVTFGSMTKVKATPPFWIWDVNGIRIEFSTTQLMDQRRVRVRVMEATNILMSTIKQSEWDKLIRERMETMEELEVPEESTTDGEIWAHFQNFAATRSSQGTKERVKNGHVLIDAGKIYFTGTAFVHYLKSQNVMTNVRDVWQVLSTHHAEHGQWKLDGQCVRIWIVPDPGVRSTEETLQMDEAM